MAATVYSAPEHITTPDLSLDAIDGYRDACEAYRQQVVDWARANTRSKNPLIGEIIDFPMGDGYASYVVFETKPLSLIHLEEGDAWHADRITLRGLRVSDIREMADRKRRLAALFSERREA